MSDERGCNFQMYVGSQIEIQLVLYELGVLLLVHIDALECDEGFGS